MKSVTEANELMLNGKLRLRIAPAALFSLTHTTYIPLHLPILSAQQAVVAIISFHPDT